MVIELADIRAARARFDDETVVRTTPVEESRSLSEAVNATVRLKMEHLQRTGSFKTRGAYNKLRRVAAEGAAGRVVAAIAGNHAQGVALAATKVGLESTVVMPVHAPQPKVDATCGYGANVVLRGDDFQAALAHARSLEDDGTAFVHAYDDPDIVAGQGTIGLELVEQVPDLDVVVVPVGGGGLIGGIAAALAELAPDVRVVGVQADGAATVSRSLASGKPIVLDSVSTVADGIATGGLSPLTFELVRRHVDEVVTVSDSDISETTLFLLERTKQLVEPAAAASVAALTSGAVDVEGETVVSILGGGNVSTTTLRAVLTHAMAKRNQFASLRIRITDRPGRMTDVSGVIASFEANIRDVRHERAVDGLDVGEAFLDVRVETTGAEHTRRIVAALDERGYAVDVLE